MSIVDSYTTVASVDDREPPRTHLTMHNAKALNAEFIWQDISLGTMAALYVIFRDYVYCWSNISKVYEYAWFLYCKDGPATDKVPQTLQDRAEELGLIGLL